LCAQKTSQPSIQNLGQLAIRKEDQTNKQTSTLINEIEKFVRYVAHISMSVSFRPGAWQCNNQTDASSSWV
jgi:hypothetical protein